MKAIVRTAALKLPPIRRLAERLAKFDSENRFLAERLAKHESENRHLAERLAKHESENSQLAAENRQLLGELATVAAERDSLDLQLYVLRSDHQRTVVRNRELTDALQAKPSVSPDQVTRQDLSALFDRLIERMTSLSAEASRSAEASQASQITRQDLSAFSDRLREDLSTASDRLIGRMTLLSSEVARVVPEKQGVADGASKYLDLLERALTGMLFEDPSISPWSPRTYDPETRLIGRDWPASALTMIGLVRLRNLRMLAETVLADGIAGDLLEAGVWRGGACILMRGVLAAHGVADRTVWVADSFAGLPPPDPETYPADAHDRHSTVDALRVPSEAVEANFRRYGLLDGQVRFLKGWFSETLPTAPVDRLAILRLDGDMYASTIQTLEALYAKVSPGGYVIVDDYILAGCRQAVDDFRARNSISSELVDVDGAAVYWRKT